jgi:hypothetical protein
MLVFECFVEIDETYIGGKPRKENLKLDADGKLKPKSKRGARDEQDTGCRSEREGHEPGLR